MVGVGHPSSRYALVDYAMYYVHSGWELNLRFVSFCLHCSGVVLYVPTFIGLFYYYLHDLHVFILLTPQNCLVRVILCCFPAKA